MYEINFKNFFGSSFVMLRIAGVWIWDDTEVKPKWYKFYAYLTRFLLANSNLIFLLNCMSYTTIREVALASYSLSLVAMTPVKAFLLHRYKEDLTELIKLLDNKYFQIKDQEEIQVANKKMESFKKIKLVYSSIFWFWLLLEILSPFFSSSDKGLIVPAYFPWDISKEPGYTFAYVDQVLCIAIGGSVTIFTDMLLSSNCTFIGLQCSLLCTRLRKIGRGDQEAAEAFSDCLKHHLNLKRYHYITNKVFGHIYFWQLFASTVSLSMILFLLSLAEPGGYEFILHLSSVMAIINILLLPCVFATVMSGHSEHISYAAFDSNWPDCNITLQKDIMYFMEHTQKPLTLHATWVFEISIPTFVTVLRASMSYYTLLTSLNSD